MAGRYGGQTPRRRRAVILASGVVGVLALAWLAWAGWSQSTPDVQSNLHSFEVVDSHSVEATVVVDIRSEDVTANCLVRAVGTDHSVVGERNFEVTGDSGASQARRHAAHRAKGHVGGAGRLHQPRPVPAPLTCAGPVGKRTILPSAVSLVTSSTCPNGQTISGETT